MAHQKKLKVLSWNILSSIWLNKNDKEYKNINSKVLRLSRRIKLVIKRLKELNADIMLLQEVSALEYDHLKKLSKEYYVADLTTHSKRHWWNEKYNKSHYIPNGNLIMINRRILAKLGDFKVVPLKLSADGNRAALLQIPKYNTVVAAVHLDDMSKRTRNQQIKTLIKSVGPDTNLIIGGDFNSPPTEYLHSTVLPLAGFHTQNIENCEQCSNGTKVSYPFAPELLIDYIYVKETSCKIGSYIVDDYLIDHNNSIPNNRETVMKYGSDHYPIIAELMF